MVQITIQQTFDLALRHRQAGRLQDAEQLYRQILTWQPENLGSIFPWLPVEGGPPFLLAFRPAFPYRIVDCSSFLLLSGVKPA
jgi:hypothetical protein